MTITYSKCPECDTYGGCAVDCWNAPWNDLDEVRTNRFGYLRRYIQWIRHITTQPDPLPLPYRPHYWYLYQPNDYHYTKATC